MRCECGCETRSCTGEASLYVERFHTFAELGKPGRGTKLHVCTGCKLSYDRIIKDYTATGGVPEPVTR